MKPSEVLKTLGFEQVVNNMGTIIWEHKLSEQYTEVIEFNCRFEYYATYTKSGKFVVKTMLIKRELHDAIHNYIAQELYWKWRIWKC